MTTNQTLADEIEGLAEKATRYFIDCEFDGHNGPLLSIALVSETGESVHIETDVQASDPWVLANVIPLMGKHDATNCTRVSLNAVGGIIREFLGDAQAPCIVADSPVDIARFCQAISTGAEGEWACTDYPRMTFEVHNVDCYPTDLPGAVQHNAWWDAMALQHKLTALRAQPSPAPEPDLYQYHPKTRTNVKHFGAAPLNDMEKEIGWTETPLWKRPPKEPGRERVDALVEALEKIMPISVEDGHDYASVYFTDGAKHRTQAMTMNPQDWLDIAAAIAAMKGEG